MNNILIIEDEKPNADRLKRLIRTLRPQVEVLAVLDSVTDTVEWFQGNTTPDAVMMDVRLSDGLSFDILEKINIPCPIIFTTAYDEYAVRAFKYNSIDYLLKPVQEDELEAALSKLEASMQRISRPALEGLLNFIQPKEYRSRFLLPYRDSYKSILVSDIAYFCHELKITRARLFDGSEEIVPQTMEELEAQLNPKCFFRANRQYIIHIDAIKQIHNYFNGKLKVDIKNNPAAEVVVSREKAALLKSWLDY